MAVKFNTKECYGCGVCKQSCPIKVIDIVDCKAKLINEGCDDCGICIDACPHGFITLDKKDD